MLKKIERLMPHAAILICNMYVVFFLIDRVNPAMNFIDNRLTKGLLLAMCAAALVNARVLLAPALGRRRIEAARRNASAGLPGQSFPVYKGPDSYADKRNIQSHITI